MNRPLYAILALWSAVLFLPLMALASEEAAPEETTEKIVCEAMQQAIEDDFAKARGCFEHAECYETLLPYPFREAACQHSFFSRREAAKVTQLTERIAEHHARCVAPFEAEKTKWEIFDRAACRRKPKELVCLNGQCATTTHVLLQNTTPEGFGVDGMGSRKALRPMIEGGTMPHEAPQGEVR